MKALMGWLGIKSVNLPEDGNTYYNTEGLLAGYCPPERDNQAAYWRPGCNGSVQLVGFSPFPRPNGIVDTFVAQNTNEEFEEAESELMKSHV